MDESNKSAIWAGEIRDYLLGRFSKPPLAQPLEGPKQSELRDPPVRRWWIFEGKQYKPLDGPLGKNWPWVIQGAWNLFNTFNPRLRLSDRPDGVVDWAHTLARGPLQFRREYVVRSSGIGLNEEDLHVLRSWVRWIDEEWKQYEQAGAKEYTDEWRNFAADVQGPFSRERLRRMAYTARRSRWPLLRGIVAESLRPLLEPEELDRIPLPTDEARLFELLCLVRIARCLAPPPRELRWMSASTDNMITLDGVRIYYQESLEKERVLNTYRHDGRLRPALELFDVRTPEFVDIAVEFESVRGGFDGLIIEVKSGSQQYDKTVAQLRAYRLARRRPGHRYLVWGIVEKPDKANISPEGLQHLFAEASKSDEDVWVFSSADAIPTIVSAALSRAPAICSS